MNNHRIGIIVGAVLCITAEVAFSQVSRYWDHGGTDDRWSNATNWTANTGPGLGEIAVLGDNAPNAPQTVLLDTDVSLDRLSCAATGTRDYTINSTNGAKITLTGGHDIFCAGRTVALTINCNIVNGGADLQIDRVGGVTTLNGDCSGGYMYAQDPGELVLAGSNSWSYIYMYGGEIVVKNAHALGNDYITAQAPVGPNATISLSTDLTLPGKLNATYPLNLRLKDSGTNDVTMTIGNQCMGDRVTLLPNAGSSTGRLTIRLTVNSSHQAEWTLTTNSTIVFANSGTASWGTADNIGSIDGDGSVVVDSGFLVTVNCTNSHTGGTTVRNGILRIGANNRLPIDGALTVESGGTFDLLARTQTVGRLTGNGTVKMGAGTAPGALTVNGTLAPGRSAGTLTFTDPGRLVLGTGSTSLFELNGLSGTNDQVAVTYPTAGVTLGGDLQIVNLGGIQAGNYKLFDLAGGAISGGYANVFMPRGWKGTLNTASGDVVLAVTNLNPGTLVNIK